MTKIFYTKSLNISFQTLEFTEIQIPCVVLNQFQIFWQELNAEYNKFLLSGHNFALDWYEYMGSK